MRRTVVVTYGSPRLVEEHASGHHAQALWQLLVVEGFLAGIAAPRIAEPVLARG